MRVFSVYFLVFRRVCFNVAWSSDSVSSMSMGTFGTQSIEELSFSSFQAILRKLRDVGLPEGLAFDHNGPYLATEQQLLDFGFIRMPPSPVRFGTSVVN
jgi:hypothetical protein